MPYAVTKHPLIQVDHALSRLESLTHGFSTLLAPAPDGNAIVAGLEWTVSEMGRHLLSGLRTFGPMVLGGAPPWPDIENGAAHNRRLIDAVPETAPQQISDAMLAELPNLLSNYRQAPDPAPWHAGLTLPLGAIAALHANDTNVHGFDLARTLKRDWPISRDDARMGLAASACVAPLLVNRAAAEGLDIDCQISLRGSKDRYLFAVHDGALTTAMLTADDDPKPNCRINADAVAFMLTSLGRTPVWKAALTGKVIASGRKPWLAAKISSIIPAP